MASSVKNGSAPTLGDAVEDWADDNFSGWRYVDQSDHDFLGPNGRKVEVKGTQFKIKNGRRNGKQCYTRGRFKFWSESHRTLLESDGVYLLVLYAEDDDPATDNDITVIHWDIVGASDVEEVVDDDWWDVQSNSRTGTKGDVYRSNWSHHIDPSEVDESW